MKIEDLFLKKEELPILHETCFQVPIHPRLLNENISINPNIAKSLFPQVAEEWSKELNRKIPHYDDLIQISGNGLVTGFQISRDYGGNIYFDIKDSNCRAFGQKYIKFSEEKTKEFKFDKNQIYCYSNNNIDYYPGALFLRNWAIMYMNEVFKKILNQT